MSKRTNHHAWTSTAANLHYVGGSGGSRAFIAGSASLLACHAAGLTDWESMGGVSGGSIATLLYTGGVHPARIVVSAVDLDFTALVTKKSTIPHFIRTKVRRKRNREPLAQGFISTEGLGEFLESLVDEWPANYWTAAVAGNTQLIFTALGVWEHHLDGRCTKLSNKPAPIGLAVRASCAVPGVLECVHYLGRNLFDGAISRHGGCPVQLVERHFGTHKDNIVALELEGHIVNHHWFDPIGEFYARFVSRSFRHRVNRHGRETSGSGAGVYIRPTINSFTSLEFSLTREQKETAVLEAFRSTVHSLAIKGLVSGSRLEQLFAACQSFEELERLYLLPVMSPAPALHHPWWQIWRRRNRQAATT